MLYRHIIIIWLLVTGGFSLAQAQRVGIVLSGGGAAATAHVGFLKALEQHEIPIDFIAGSSMGAIIAGLYASGWSPEAIEAYMLSEEFEQSMRGDPDNEFRFYFKQRDALSSWLTFKLSTETWIQTSLPTNRIDPQLQDFRSMEVFSVSAARAEYDFDSLFVPFRCVASDIERKEQVIFRNGNLNQAIRASATYPFYVPPIEVNGRLLFDGGIYNNFPADVLYNDFLPDVILGSNVSQNPDSPTKDDVLSQLKSMIMYSTNFEKLCEHMIIVQPESRVGTFDFENADAMMIAGYRATMMKMDEIKANVTRRVDAAEIQAKRSKFRSGFQPLIFDEITLTGLRGGQRNYIRKVLGKSDTVSVARLTKRYFRAFNDDKINYIYPTAILKPETGYYNLQLDVDPEKDLHMDIGGVFSSRPFNTGFVAVRYNLMGGLSSTLKANSYFGKFYGSVMVAPRLDFPSGFPVAVEPHFVINRWDYFKSLATFFEDVRPSFIVKKESYGGLHFIMPAGNLGKMVLDGRVLRWQDDYYQTDAFTNADTADRTMFNAITAGGVFEINTLNRKQYASTGTHLKFSLRYTTGEERTIPGSTSAQTDTLFSYHDWVMARLVFKHYFKPTNRFTIGLAVEGAATDQPFFNNYIATTIRAPAFNPIPESNTFFLPQLIGHLWSAVGVTSVATLTKNLDLRGEGYLFVPFGRIVPNELNQATYDYRPERFFVGSGALVFHSPIGPAALSVNYYDRKEDPWSVLFTFGYLLFNRSAVD